VREGLTGTFEAQNVNSTGTIYANDTIQSTTTSAEAVYGNSSADEGDGVYGAAFGANGTGVVAQGSVDGIYARGGVLAGDFDGNVNISGALTRNVDELKIDNPLDPANKYLYHAPVESPEMKNVYDGVVTTDAKGFATVTMPDYFEALNRDYRYQLTTVGQFAQAMVAKKIVGGKFVIQTDKPNVEVSWQITGIRQDAWAKAHPTAVEESKAETDKGRYLHPELFGHQGDVAIGTKKHLPPPAHPH
jgi:hypothetical protein